MGDNIQSQKATRSSATLLINLIYLNKPCLRIPTHLTQVQNILTLFSAHWLLTLARRAGKKLNMSARRQFEGSEMSSKVRDFLPQKMRQQCVILGPSSMLPQSSNLDPQPSIFNPNPNHHPQYFLNPHPQSSPSILNCLSYPKSQQNCGILGPKCPQK